MATDDDIDITGWTEAQITRWEDAHERFATEARANAAADAADREQLTPEVLAESERWAKVFDEEARREPEGYDVMVEVAIVDADSGDEVFTESISGWARDPAHIERTVHQLIDSSEFGMGLAARAQAKAEEARDDASGTR